MDTQLDTSWAELFDCFTLQVHPWLPQLCRNYPMNYYWTCQDSEWAMDLVFRDRQQLQRLYPQLVHLGMTSFSSPDGLRLMGKRVTRQGTAFGAHEAPVSSDLKVRPNGVRIKRRLGANSQWRAMRRGLADLYRRAQVSQKALDCSGTHFTAGAPRPLARQARPRLASLPT